MPWREVFNGIGFEGYNRRVHYGLRSYDEEVYLANGIKLSCLAISNFDSFIDNMTQGKFYTLWNFIKTVKLESFFWDNFDWEERQSVRVKIPSCLYWQLNSAKWFTQKNEDGNYFERICDVDMNCIPDAIKAELEKDEDLKQKWELLRKDLTDIDDFRSLLAFSKK